MMAVGRERQRQSERLVLVPVHVAAVGDTLFLFPDESRPPPFLELHNCVEKGRK